MSVTPEAKTSTLFEWLKSNGVVAITIMGVLLYVVFSIPATYFYARLGTTPGEVGITYTSVLSGSTLGVLLILAALTPAAIYIFILALRILVVVALFAVFNFLRHPRLLFRKDHKLDAEQFELKLWIFKTARNNDGSSWEEIERALRRSRELKRKEHLTRTEAFEMKTLNSRKIYRRVAMSNFLNFRQWLRRSARYVYGLFPIFVVIATVVLIILARFQAGEVLRGESYFGSQVGLFDYHAERVTIKPVSANYAESLLPLAGKRWFLLGQNTQYMIVFSPDSRLTVRIPVTAVILTSSP